MAANYPPLDRTADIYNDHKSEAIVRKFTRPAIKEILGLQYQLCELLKGTHAAASPPNDETVDPDNTSQAQQTSATPERHATGLSETFLLLKEYRMFNSFIAHMAFHLGCRIYLCRYDGTH
jgi:hypothetical protein